jgi:hypothetical protein
MWWDLLQGQTINKVESKTGVYFDKVGTVFFYPTKWKIVTYINLEPTRELWRQTKSQQRKANEFCQKIKNRNWYRHTDCASFKQYVISKSNYIDNLKNLIVNYVSGSNQNINYRFKRGVLNVLGEVSKLLFGTLTQSDARSYNQHISELEKEQKEFLHLSKEHVTFIKTTITSVNSTLQKINQNEKKLEKDFEKLLNYSTHKFKNLEEEFKHLNLINEQIRLIHKGMDESQHSFEILIDALIQAKQGVLQPHLITTEKIKELLRTQKLPTGLDYPNFPFPELQKIITPSTYSYNQYLVYILDIPLFLSTQYKLYKVLPFPVKIDDQTSTYSYLESTKEFIFIDDLNQHFGKMTTSELTNCFELNFSYVCKAEIPIYVYVPDMDCEATLLHTSTTKLPKSCEHRIFKLSTTFWIPLHMSNQWLFVTPEMESFTILCPYETTTITLQKEGILSLKPGCKGYSAYVTLYAMSILTVNLTNDFIPTVPIDFDCCFDDIQEVKFDDIPLRAPSVNIMSSSDELRLISLKTDEVQRLIKEQESKSSQNFYSTTTAWSTILGIICLIIICICCSYCCCKCSRKYSFWIWKKLTPKECWHQAQKGSLVSINNYSGSRIVYTKANRSSPTSFESLPYSENIIHTNAEELALEEQMEPIAIRTRSKKMFR